jgi:hypothetical protein
MMVFIVVLLLQLIFAAADQLTQEPESQLLIYVGKKKRGTCSVISKSGRGTCCKHHFVALFFFLVPSCSVME